MPEGYALRTFRTADRDAWIRLMRSAGFDGWSHDTLKQSLACSLPEGVFFVEHGATRELVATAMAGHRATDLHPFGGELGWVAVSPPHRGKRLSAIVCAEVTRRLLSAGYREIYLQTDDWRLPAVKTYMNLGYVPLLCDSDMQERWRFVCRNLDLRYEDVGARSS
jgi:mycothiol synthase